MADTSASMATASGSTFSVTSPTTLRFTVIFFVRCNFDRRFGDHAEQVHGSGPYATLVVQYSEGDRVIFFRQLRAVQQMRGYKSGWAAHKFKDKFGHFPPWAYNDLAPAAPTDAVLSWVRSRNIAWAKCQPARVAA
jgi:hypothetical protein